ncbi:hypothetical protein ACERK3_09575 [Phycisphaerales bacterium AB-hyl4]|uniref:Uncharacterized protein n=1 Tax=Natronomicrosphaera hydrolytica TaxID=3242702 RepID=A0ABV4U4L5_9BACT
MINAQHSKPVTADSLSPRAQLEGRINVAIDQVEREREAEEAEHRRREAEATRRAEQRVLEQVRALLSSLADQLEAAGFALHPFIRSGVQVPGRERGVAVLDPATGRADVEIQLPEVDSHNIGIIAIGLQTIWRNPVTHRDAFERDLLARIGQTRRSHWNREGSIDQVA